MLNGRLTGINAETGELTVEVPPGPETSGRAQVLLCDVTRNSEIYVNDRLRTYQALAVGDAVEMIVMRESQRALDRYAVAFVSVRHDLPAPPPVFPGPAAP